MRVRAIRFALHRTKSQYGCDLRRSGHRVGEHWQGFSVHLIGLHTVLVRT
jgi:hypothetical protein